MTKKEMTKMITEKTAVTQNDVESVFTAYADIVKELLASDNDEKVTLPDLGAFSVKTVAARTGIVMMGESKGSTWATPAHNEITFKVSKSVKNI